MTEELLQKFDELISVTRAASLPVRERWLDAEGVAALISFKPRYVLENLSCRPDFPRPLRLDGTGHPRWKAGEVLDWATRQRNATGGRPRATA
jgi:predicted DNA-binding transcriptional regulator AlpA